MIYKREKIHPLKYQKFVDGIAECINKELLVKYPQISEPWLKHELYIDFVVYEVIDIFITAIRRGHIFYDDLFNSTIEKYSNNDISYFIEENERIVNYFKRNRYFKDMDWDFILEYNTSLVKKYLLCYDFCKNYLAQFYSLIYEMAHIMSLDRMISHAVLNERTPHKILNEAVVKERDSVLWYLEKKSIVSYIDTSNNLQDVLARIDKMQKEKKRKKLPYSFNADVHDRLIRDILKQHEEEINRIRFIHHT